MNVGARQQLPQIRKKQKNIVISKHNKKGGRGSKI